MSDKDETKGTPSDESTKGTPKDESKGTPKDKGKLYTDAQIEKFKSDAAAMGQGRAEKVAKQEKEALTQELESIKNRFDALEKETRETRLAEARGDPTQLRTFQREEALSRREREVEDKDRDLTRREGLLKADREEVDKDKGEVGIAYVAASHGLKVEDLEEFSDLKPEALEKLAVRLAAAKPKGEGEGEGGEGEEGAESLKLDSGEGSGSGEPTEQQRLDTRYPTMKKP